MVMRNEIGICLKARRRARYKRRGLIIYILLLLFFFFWFLSFGIFSSCSLVFFSNSHEITVVDFGLLLKNVSSTDSVIDCFIGAYNPLIFLFLCCSASDDERISHHCLIS